MIKQYGYRCLECLDEIYSNSVHDFVSCKCGAAFVDGGFVYLRAGANSLDRIEKIEREVDRSTLPRYFRED